MSFHLSAEDIRVEDRSFLRARLRNEDGDLVDAELDLNSVLGNSEGRFEWGGQNYAYSANPDEEISFSLEGDDNVPILRAHLADSNGEWHWHDVNLAERIGNHNGSFGFS